MCRNMLYCHTTKYKALLDAAEMSVDIAAYRDARLALASGNEELLPYDRG